jgi:hypothetical protein
MATANPNPFELLRQERQKVLNVVLRLRFRVFCHSFLGALWALRFRYALGLVRRSKIVYAN